MNTSDVRTLDAKGLLLRHQDLIGELASLRFQHATGQLDNTSALKRVRRDLARVNTVIRERELDEGLNKGSLAVTVGKLDAGESAFGAFRKRMSAVAEG